MHIILLLCWWLVCFCNFTYMFCCMLLHLWAFITSLFRITLQVTLMGAVVLKWVSVYLHRACKQCDMHPAAGYMLFLWSTVGGGNVQTKAVKKKRLCAHKQECKYCAIFKKYLQKSALQMLAEKAKAFNTFVTPQSSYKWYFYNVSHDNVKGVAQCDKNTENYHLIPQFSSA